jgi:glycosyltransferase involved in cell wall biosynthesis
VLKLISLTHEGCYSTSRQLEWLIEAWTRQGVTMRRLAIHAAWRGNLVEPCAVVGQATHLELRPYHWRLPPPAWQFLREDTETPTLLWCPDLATASLARRIKGRVLELQWSLCRVQRLQRSGRRPIRPDVLLTDDPRIAATRLSRDPEWLSIDDSDSFHRFFPGVPDLAPPSEHERAETRRQLGVPLNSMLCVTASRLVESSNLKDLIWAIDLIKCIREDIHLVICGDGPRRWPLEKFLRATESNSHVHFVSGHERTASLIRAADIYWSADRDIAHPTGVLEAMALKIPVVSLVTEANADLIRHQQTALGVEFGRRDQFARWTKFLLEQDHRRQQLVDQAAQAVRTHFHMARTADALMRHCLSDNCPEEA